jgi:hypothetical protein
MNILIINQSTPINYPIIIVPVGCQFNIPNRIMCSGGFLVYNKPSEKILINYGKY